MTLARCRLEGWWTRALKSALSHLRQAVADVRAARLNRSISYLNAWAGMGLRLVVHLREYIAAGRYRLAKECARPPLPAGADASPYEACRMREASAHLAV